jgi:hypothetical protein
MDLKPDWVKSWEEGLAAVKEILGTIVLIFTWPMVFSAKVVEMHKESMPWDPEIGFIWAFVIAVMCFGMWLGKWDKIAGLVSKIPILYQYVRFYVLGGALYTIIHSGWVIAIAILAVTIMINEPERWKKVKQGGGTIRDYFFGFLRFTKKGVSAIAIVGGKAARIGGKAYTRLAQSPLKEAVDEALEKIYAANLYDDASFERNARDLEEKLKAKLPAEKDEIHRIIYDPMEGFMKRHGIGFKEESDLEKAFQQELDL